MNRLSVTSVILAAAGLAACGNPAGPSGRTDEALWRGAVAAVDCRDTGGNFRTCDYLTLRPGSLDVRLVSVGTSVRATLSAASQGELEGSGDSSGTLRLSGSYSAGNGTVLMSTLTIPDFVGQIHGPIMMVEYTETLDYYDSYSLRRAVRQVHRVGTLIRQPN